MNKIRTFWRIKKPSAFAWLGIVTALILSTGILCATLILIKTSVEEDFISRPLCLTNECTRIFLSKTDQSFAIAKATLDVGVAFATIGGIFVALLSYFNTAGNAALTNHIEHLKVFSEYVETEIRKRDRLASNLIDTLLFYETIFNQSRVGKTSVSNAYKKFIEDLNEIIKESNARSVVGTPGGFSYRDHQKRIRDHLAKAGITTYIAPRNDYFEMEEQLLSLLHRINQSFCQRGALPDILPRSYC